MKPPSYHDVCVTAPGVPRTQLSRLPMGYELACNRVTGWILWAGVGGANERMVGGEFEGADRWLVVDVAGHVIVDSRGPVDPTG